MTARTSLYRLRDQHGTLLYVGIAGNPGRRFGQHSKSKSWWDEVATIDLQHYDTREEALLAETIAIRTEGPAYNIVKGDPRPRIRLVHSSDPEVAEALLNLQRAYAATVELLYQKREMRSMAAEAVRMVDYYDRCEVCDLKYLFLDQQASKRYPWISMLKANGDLLRAYACHECGHEWKLWTHPVAIDA